MLRHESDLAGGKCGERVRSGRVRVCRSTAAIDAPGVPAPTYDATLRKRRMWRLNDAFDHRAYPPPRSATFASTMFLGCSVPLVADVADGRMDVSTKSIIHDRHQYHALSQYRRYMAAIIRHLRHHVLAIVMFSRL